MTENIYNHENSILMSERMLQAIIGEKISDSVMAAEVTLLKILKHIAKTDISHEGFDTLVENIIKNIKENCKSFK